MASLNRIELFLNIDLTNTRLRDGLKKKNKNQFYWFQNLYLIVKLSQEKWCVVGCNERTFDLLNDNVFCCNCKGYMHSTNGFFHVLLMNPPHGLVVDHIKRNPYDNRLENLRIVTPEQNSRNRTKPSTNTSGNMGVYKRKKNGNEYWIAQIADNNNNKIQKCFSCKKLGNEIAKQQAIQQRNEWKIEFNYQGE